LEQQKKQQDVQPQQPSVSAEMRELELWLRQQDAQPQQPPVSAETEELEVWLRQQDTQPQHQQPGSDNWAICRQLADSNTVLPGVLRTNFSRTNCSFY
jgi:hypothetical protein